MKPPLLSFYGELVGAFPIFSKAKRAVDNIISPVTLVGPPQTRMCCYDANLLGDRFIDLVCSYMNIEREAYDFEIFIPDAEYPPHTDEGGWSFMIPLGHNCFVRLANQQLKLVQWAVYGFEDSVPHATWGPMLMFKVKGNA